MPGCCRFFFALASTSLPNERLLAIDLYEDQGSNKDGSGGTDATKRSSEQGASSASWHVHRGMEGLQLPLLGKGRHGATVAVC